jgi:4-oxalomesaconate tautomerase
MSGRQTAIPCTLMRGGTSKGPFFLASDLPAEPATRDAVLLAIMGSPDARQIDGLGGAEPLTSKVAIVSKSQRAGIDVDFLFAQVLIDKPLVDVSPNCGNMLAGVGPFAIERGLVRAADPATRVAIYMVNTGNLALATVQTPGREVRYDGATAIAGVPGTAAPISIDFLDTAGSVCESLLPTGRARDRIEGIDVTCIDNGMPVVVMAAEALGVTGYESRDELNADAALKQKIESIRLQAGPAMNLGDVTKKVVPKMCLVAKPAAGGQICTRTFIPHDCHSAVGVLGAVTVATAAVMPGSVANRYALVPPGLAKSISVEHPSGEFSVILTMSAANPTEVLQAALLRTARLIMRGEVYVPTSNEATGIP